MRLTNKLAPLQADVSRFSGNRDSGGRLLPPKAHPGVATVHDLSDDEHREWKRWTPKTGDVVLVELPDDGVWPGKVTGSTVIVSVNLLILKLDHRQTSVLPGANNSARQPLLPRAHLP